MIAQKFFCEKLMQALKDVYVHCENKKKTRATGDVELSHLLKRMVNEKTYKSNLNKAQDNDKD